MTYFRLFSRILTVAGLLIFFAEPLRADPVVTFGNNGANPALTILNLEQFIVGTTNANGTLTVVMRNGTSLTFLDFHFVTMSEQSGRWTGNGMPFFGNFSSTANSIDFFRGGTGTGISPNTTFTVTFTGFSPNQIIRGTATIPEPATIFLLGTGLAAIGIKVRKMKVLKMR